MSRLNRREGVLSLQLALERAWQPRGASNVHAFIPLGLSANQRLLERLEGENAQLRDSVVDLMLQIQALRGARGHPRSEIQPNGRRRPRAMRTL
jgi:hypothetical protein